jgi:hypothetical protein
MAPVQHYVPQFLLRNFCAGAKPRIWAYDKSTGKSFETNVRNIAGEREFYDLTVGDATLSLEEGLSKLETQAGAVIDRIIGARNLGVLSEDDRAVLAVFVSTQMQRGPNQRESMLALNQELRRVLKGRFGIEDGEFPELTPEEAKAMTMKSLTESQKFAEHILNKAWLMFETTPRASVLHWRQPGHPGRASRCRRPQTTYSTTTRCRSTTRSDTSSRASPISSSSSR